MQSLIIQRLLAIVVLGVMVSEANEHTYNKGCKKPTDVIFLLDASSSITEQDFRKHLDFVRNVIQDLGPSMVRSGLVTYGDQDRLEFGLQTYSSAETAMKAASMKSQLRGGTRTDLALRRMSQMMADDKRPGATQVGVVLTDGLSDYPADTKVEVEVAREARIGLFAVGVGDEVDADELMTIAKTKDHLLRIHSASDLDSLKNALWRSICSHSEQQQQHAVENKNNTRASTEGEVKVAGDPMDLTFLLDTSIESFPENMEGRHRFVNDCLSHMPGSKDNARVSVITFGNLAQIQLDVKAHSSLRDVRLAFEGIGMRSARTDVANALSILGSSSSEEKYRKQSKKAAVIVTAGRVGDPQSAKIEASKLMNEKGVAIFVVGVGPEVDRSELESMASYHSDQTSFLIDDYESLGSIAHELMKTICGPNPAASKSPSPQQTKQPPLVTAGIASINSFTITATTVPIRSTTTTQLSRARTTRKSNWKTAGKTATESPRARVTESFWSPLSASLAQRTQSSTMPTSTGQNNPIVTSTQDVWRKRTSRTSAQPRTPPNLSCTSLKPIDIVFALPCSPGQSDTSHAMEFIKILGEQLGFDGEAVRMGVTPRFCPPHAEGIITIDEDSMIEGLRRAMDHRWLTSIRSDIVSQLRHLNDVRFSEQHMAGRSDAVKMAVVFFERKVTISEEVTVEANRLKRMDVVLVGISVGEEDDTSGGLAQLTSCQNCLFHAKSYADLDGQLSDRLATIAMIKRCIIDIPPE